MHKCESKCIKIKPHLFIHTGISVCLLLMQLFIKFVRQSNLYIVNQCIIDMRILFLGDREKQRKKTTTTITTSISFLQIISKIKARIYLQILINCVRSFRGRLKRTMAVTSSFSFFFSFFLLFSFVNRSATNNCNNGCFELPNR